MWRSTCPRALLQVDADLAGLARRLKKPLRPLWISQESRIWIDQVAHPDDLPFTPVILVSASLPNARQRRFAREWPPLLLKLLLQWGHEQCTLFWVVGPAPALEFPWVGQLAILSASVQMVTASNHVQVECVLQGCVGSGLSTTSCVQGRAAMAGVAGPMSMCQVLEMMRRAGQRG